MGMFASFSTNLVAEVMGPQDQACPTSIEGDSHKHRFLPEQPVAKEGAVGRAYPSHFCRHPSKFDGLIFPIRFRWTSDEQSNSSERWQFPRPQRCSLVIPSIVTGESVILFFYSLIISPLQHGRTVLNLIMVMSSTWRSTSCSVCKGLV